MIFDGSGHFSPAGIVGVHTLTLLLSSRTAYDRAVGNANVTQNRTRRYTTAYSRRVKRGYSNLS